MLPGEADEEYGVEEAVVAGSKFSQVASDEARRTSGP